MNEDTAETRMKSELFTSRLDEKIIFEMETHVGAKSALLRRLFLPAAQKAAGRVAPLLLLPEKGLARLAYSLASGLGPLWGPFKTDRGGSRDLVYGSLSLTTFFGKGQGRGCFS